MKCDFSALGDRFLFQLNIFFWCQTNIIFFVIIEFLMHFSSSSLPVSNVFTCTFPLPTGSLFSAVNPSSSLAIQNMHLIQFWTILEWKRKIEAPNLFYTLGRPPDSKQMCRGHTPFLSRNATRHVSAGSQAFTFIKKKLAISTYCIDDRCRHVSIELKTLKKKNRIVTFTTGIWPLLFYWGSEYLLTQMYKSMFTFQRNKTFHDRGRRKSDFNNFGIKVFLLRHKERFDAVTPTFPG